MNNSEFVYIVGPSITNIIDWAKSKNIDVSKVRPVTHVSRLLGIRPEYIIMLNNSNHLKTYPSIMERINLESINIKKEQDYHEN